MKKQWLVYLGIFIALLPLTILRDYTPNNELRYLSIADEAIENGHVFAFYNQGVPYADKPPLYLWFVMAFKALLGKHVIFLLSMLSVIPALITLRVMDRWIRRELTENERVSATLMLFGCAFFLASAIVLRMDMMMAMFITLALYTFYRMYTYTGRGNDTKYRQWQILLPVYIFLAIFSKGPVGFLVPIVSILVYLVVKRDLRSTGRYLGWKTWTILISLCAVWFVGVYLDGGKAYLNDLLFNQTINRAVDSFHHKRPFYYYAISYWYVIAPWSLLVFSVVVTAFVKRLVRTDLEKFFATTALSTLIMMSCVSSKIEIYLLPCFPPLLCLTALLLPKVKNSIWVRISIAVPALIFLLIFPLSLFISGNTLELPFMKHPVEIPFTLWAPYQVFTAILLIGGTACLVFLRKNRLYAATNSIVLSLLTVLFAASFSLKRINPTIGLEYAAGKAVEISRETGIGRFGIYGWPRGASIDVYFKENPQVGNDFQIDLLERQDLEELSEPMILLIKPKRLQREAGLKEMIKDKEQYDGGMVRIIVME